MKLITELFDDVEILAESTDSGAKKYTISGIFAQAETLNRNQRVYPKEILEREINSHINEKVLDRRAYGELNHPAHFQVNPDRISHRITELRFDGNNVWGKANILDNACGKILESIIKDGGKFGMSTRAIGSIKKNSKGLNEVQQDLKLSCVDAVIDPSGIDCWVDGILESKEFVYVDGIITESTIENYQKTIKKLTTKELNEVKLNLFDDFINKLKNK
jgi:hypothetical protein